MSFQAMAWAVGLELPTREKFILIMLANYADEQGKCWPSRSRICSDTGMSESTVRLAIIELEKRKLISVEKRLVDTSNLSNVFTLKFEGVGRLPRGVGRQTVGGGSINGPKPINEPININNIDNKPSVYIDSNTRATRLPSSWQPSASDLEFARKLGVSPDEASAFRDYWLSKPKDNTKLDWSATWRNWCRRAKPQSTRTPEQEKKDEWKLAVSKLRERAQGARPDEGEGAVIDADFTRTA